MKKIVFICCLLFLFVISCTKRLYVPEEVYYSVDFETSPSSTVVKKTPPAAIKPDSTVDIPVQIEFTATDKIENVIRFSESFIGTPYKYGGTTPSGFDCSGFIMYIFKNKNVDMPRTIDGMISISDKIDKNDIQRGDLVFFKGRNINSNDIGHVALVTEKTKNGFKMIHATTSKGVIINDFEQYEYWKSRYLFATRIKKEFL
jgi:cell wall-associated NlpC family hydrolase